MIAPASSSVTLLRCRRKCYEFLKYLALTAYLFQKDKLRAYSVCGIVQTAEI